MQFRNIRSGDAGFVCGELNAKNGFGGYAGFTRFISRDSGNVVLEDLDTRPDELFQKQWGRLCESQSMTKAQRDSFDLWWKEIGMSPW